MKINIYAQPVTKNRTGVGYYTYHLVKSLLKIDHKNFYQIVLFDFLGKNGLRPFGVGKNFRYSFIKITPGRIYEKIFKKGLKIPIDWLGGKADVHVFPNFIAMPVTSGKVVSFVYDLSFARYPQFAEPKNQRYMTDFLPESIKKSDHIITISQFSKKEIVEYYQADPGKITIIYPSVDEKFYRRNEGEVQKVREKYQLTRDYILYLGTLEPRKNLVKLLESYLNLPDELKNSFEMVWGGGLGWQYQETLTRLNEAPEKYRPRKLGYIDEEDLPSLYSGAALVVFPSIYEGFGMPVAEAMACGSVVLTSNTTSIPEVAGDAAIMVDPNSVSEITGGLKRGLTDQDLRKSLSKLGPQQAAKFSWDREALKLRQVLEELGNG